MPSGQRRCKRAGPKPAEEPVDKSVAGANEKPANAGQAEHGGRAGTEAVKPAAPNDDARRYITIGSVDSDYRMGVTFSREGAALARLELSSQRYRDLDDRTGYLGHLVMDDTDRGPGCLVQAVVAGTPAAKAGIKPGDRIMRITYRGKDTEIDNPFLLESVLRTTEPRDTIELEVRRAPEPAKKGDLPQKADPPKRVEHLTATLTRRPLEVIRPERSQPSLLWVRNGPTDAIMLGDNCPLSFLTTLQQVDDEKIPADEGPARSSRMRSPASCRT